jgi:hypothetical protein
MGRHLSIHHKGPLVFQESCLNGPKRDVSTSAIQSMSSMSRILCPPGVSHFGEILGVSSIIPLPAAGGPHVLKKVIPLRPTIHALLLPKLVGQGVSILLVVAAASDCCWRRTSSTSTGNSRSNSATMIMMHKQEEYQSRNFPPHNKPE